MRFTLYESDYDSSDEDCCDMEVEELLTDFSEKMVRWVDEASGDGSPLETVVEFYTSLAEIHERRELWHQIHEASLHPQVLDPEEIHHPQVLPEESVPEEPPVVKPKKAAKLRRSKRITALKRKQAREAPPTRRSARIAALTKKASP